MAEINATFAKMFPDWRKPAIHYGYQQQDAQDFVFPPYIWIRMMELDKEPTQEFIRNELVRDLNPEDGVKMGDPVLDPSLEAFVVEANVNHEGQVPTKSIVALFPTKKGLLKVFGFMSQDDARNHPELLRQVLGGIHVYNDYKPANAKRSLTGLLVSVIAIGIMVLVIWKSKPVKSHSEGSPTNPPSAS